MDIQPDYGATSTIFTEYLYNLELRPGSRLATALQFGIRTDTMNFQRHARDVDMRAYQYLNKFADAALLARITQSELRLDWLPRVAAAIQDLRKAGTGYFAFLDKVQSPDILVLAADFLTRVYEIRWAAVSGVYDKTVVVVFRGDGLTMDMGRLAKDKFNALGSAGGHKTMARAEIPLEAVGDEDLGRFIFNTLTAKPSRPRAAPGAV
jgi:nanoRNase/pAp phosphatase (c-di-AMP/oligoRNAs hydrolase)